MRARGCSSTVMTCSKASFPDRQRRHAQGFPPARHATHGSRDAEAHRGILQIGRSGDRRPRRPRRRRPTSRVSSSSRRPRSGTTWPSFIDGDSITHFGGNDGRQVAQRLVLGVRYPDRRQISAPVTARHLQRIAPVRLDAVARLHRYQRRRYHIELHAQTESSPIAPESDGPRPPPRISIQRRRDKASPRRRIASRREYGI